MAILRVSHLRNRPMAKTTPTTPVVPAAAFSSAHTQRLAGLGAQFDSLLAAMQAPAAKKGMRAAFEAAPGALGRSAVKAARKRA